MSNLTNPSQLLIRNAMVLDCHSMLLVQPPCDDLVVDLQIELPNVQLNVFTTHDPVHSALLKRLPSDQVQFGFDLQEGSESYDHIVVFLQKSRALMDMLLDRSSSMLKANGTIFVVGENSTGIKSWRKRLKERGEAVQLDSARHSGLISITGLSAFNGLAVNKRFENVPVSVAGQSMSIRSLPGVFSHGRLDVGTRLLLETIQGLKTPFRPGSHILDFGSGAGIIGCWLGLAVRDSKLTLVDCDALAVESSRKSLAANDLSEQSNVIASDGMNKIKGRFDNVISNPPFHDGVKTSYDVTERFLAESSKLLKPGGRLIIVANSFLTYEPIIQAAFGNCQQLARRDGFVIYMASK